MVSENSSGNKSWKQYKAELSRALDGVGVSRPSSEGQQFRDAFLAALESPVSKGKAFIELFKPFSINDLESEKVLATIANFIKDNTVGFSEALKAEYPILLRTFSQEDLVSRLEKKVLEIEDKIADHHAKEVQARCKGAINYLSNDLSNELKRVMREKALNQDAMVNEDIVRMSIEKTKALVDVLNKQASMKRPPGLDTSSLSDMGSEPISLQCLQENLQCLTDFFETNPGISSDFGTHLTSANGFAEWIIEKESALKAEQERIKAEQEGREQQRMDQAAREREALNVSPATTTETISELGDREFDLISSDGTLSSNVSQLINIEKKIEDIRQSITQQEEKLRSFQQEISLISVKQKNRIQPIENLQQDLKNTRHLIKASLEAMNAIDSQLVLTTEELGLDGGEFLEEKEQIQAKILALKVEEHSIEQQLDVLEKENENDKTRQLKLYEQRKDLETEHSQNHNNLGELDAQKGSLEQTLQDLRAQVLDKIEPAVTARAERQQAEAIAKAEQQSLLQQEADACRAKEAKQQAKERRASEAKGWTDKLEVYLNGRNAKYKTRDTIAKAVKGEAGTQKKLRTDYINELKEAINNYVESGSETDKGALQTKLNEGDKKFTSNRRDKTQTLNYVISTIRRELEGPQVENFKAKKEVHQENLDNIQKSVDATVRSADTSRTLDHRQ